MLLLPILLEAFNTEAAPGAFPSAENQEENHEEKMITMHERYTRDHQARTAADPILGFRWSKAPNSMGKISILEILRLRAISALSRDKSVRRSAQDDDFAGVSKKNTRKLALMGLRPGLQHSLRSTLVRSHADPRALLFPVRRARL